MSPDGATVTSLTRRRKCRSICRRRETRRRKRIRRAHAARHGRAGAGAAERGLRRRRRVPRDAAGRRQAAGARAPRARRSGSSSTPSPGSAPLERADFRGNAQLRRRRDRPPRRRARSTTSTSDQLDLSLSAGDTGKGPILNNPQLTVQALNIHLSPSTQKLKADTDVRSTSSRRSRPAAAGSAAARHAGQTRAGDAEAGPAGERHRRIGWTTTASSEATYSGNALLWQDKSRIAGRHHRARTTRTGNLTAQRKRPHDDDARGRRSEDEGAQADGDARSTADMLVYDDAKRLATYTATGTTPASLTSPQGDMTRRPDRSVSEGERQRARAR